MTPGSRANSSSTCWNSSIVCVLSKPLRRGDIVNVTTSSTCRPRSTCVTLTRLLRKRPEQISRPVASAIWAVTSAERNRAAPRCPAIWPALARIASMRLERVLCSAGKRPKASPVPTASRAAKAITDGWMLNCMMVEVSAGSRVASSRSVTSATARLATPPMRARSTDSVSSWAIRCRRPAPRARRTPISLARPAARASRRLAMLAQAMRSTTAVTPNSIASGVLASRCIWLWPR